MHRDARTPEELETLLEDALVVGDPAAVARLFEAGAVLGAARAEARGREPIGRLAAALCRDRHGYVADVRRVVQAGETALVIGAQGIGVARRGRGGWRYAISLLHTTRGVDMTEARWWFGALAEIVATAADTDGRLTIIDVTEPPGAEAPLHVHHREDEGFWILEGTVTLQVGDATVEARAGDFAWGPRDVPHRYTVGPEGCRMLFICTPAGFEGLVRDMSVPAAARTLPPPSADGPDMEMVASVADRYGCELLG